MTLDVACCGSRRNVVSGRGRPVVREVGGASVSPTTGQPPPSACVGVGGSFSVVAQMFAGTGSAVAGQSLRHADDSSGTVSPSGVSRWCERRWTLRVVAVGAMPSVGVAVPSFAQCALRGGRPRRPGGVGLVGVVAFRPDVKITPCGVHVGAVPAGRVGHPGPHAPLTCLFHRQQLYGVGDHIATGIFCTDDVYIAAIAAFEGVDAQ